MTSVGTVLVTVVIVCLKMFRFIALVKMRVTKMITLVSRIAVVTIYIYILNTSLMMVSTRNTMG